jgi:hypothetical protein
MLAFVCEETAEVATRCGRQLGVDAKGMHATKIGLIFFCNVSVVPQHRLVPRFLKSAVGRSIVHL